MIDGITIIAWAPIVAALRATTGTAAPWAVPNWDSRECPGPNSEASLSRPSTGRVLAASALALAVSSPALESVEPAREIVHTQASVPAVAARQPRLELRLMQRVSRSTVRRTATRPTVIALRAARRSVARELVRISAVRRDTQARRAAARREAARPNASTKPRIEARHRGSHARHHDGNRAGLRMTSVIAYARSQLGKNYRRGGVGPNSFDCSGFTKRAYARVGLRLPHSSGGQAARARSISRTAARPGDLVVGPGHVGIYMGGGMMIDAGNPRTGVVYRRLYGGLHIERF
jgi:cell wall-associated NlpC family hydrolase